MASDPTMSKTNRTDLSKLADALRARHRPGSPLLLPNIWDVAGARLVAAAGFPVIATSSAAVAESLGYEDDDSMPADDAFAVVARIARAVALPVTADMEAGYGLSAEAFVECLLVAGAVGCNLEDSDHRGSGLVDATQHARRLVEIKAVARQAGVDLVLNARVDVGFAATATADTLAEGVRRGRLYREAGADCVYPIFLRDEQAIASFVAGVECPVNILLRSGDGRDVSRLAGLGVARISLGSGLLSAARDGLNAALARLQQA